MGRPLIQQVSFADAEMRMQGIVLDPIMQRISKFLDRQGDLLNKVHADLMRGLKRPKAGRDGIDAVQVLRSLILARVKNWDLRELRERITDGYTLRIFTRFYSARVPDHRTFSRNFNKLQPDTMRLLNDAVIDAAVQMRLADVRKLRTDTTVVETNIHFPTDSGLLWDLVRVQTRLINVLREELGKGLECEFSDRTRRARRRMQEIHRMTGRTRTRQQVRKYRDLIHVTEEVMQMAALHANASKGLLDGLDPMRAALVEEVAAEIEHFGRLASASSTRLAAGS